ncbi:MAG: sn-glycerol-3-phosphate ABC transporter ATP-binding protein UgpC [Granulosicoccus sp.]|nr:sn-glycerol-3-phosphate ABC transporter ATP-binding protein UgpC [Granulosicoccus sp.]
MNTSAVPFLEIDKLSKSFGGVDALKDVSIAVEEGGFLVLVGPSGCGKSTLLNMIAGFEPASSGDIRIAGKSIAGLHPSRRNIAMVFQSYALYPNMTVAGNIGFGMETRGVPKARRLERIAEVASILQIEPLLNRKPAQLSGGQRQRVAMGRALVRDPLAFLFDEPLSNLDARLRVDMRAEIKKLHARLGTTIVYVTHDQIEAMTLATKIAVLKQGCLQQVGTPDEIYSRPANTFVADFMGSPAMNRLTVSLEESAAGLNLLFGRFRLPLAAPASALLDRCRSGKAVEFGIRSEDIAQVENSGTDRPSLDLTVELIEPTGSDTFLETRDEAVHFTARVANQCRVRVGDTVPLEFDMSKAHFFDSESGQRIC